MGKREQDSVLMRDFTDAGRHGTAPRTKPATPPETMVVHPAEPDGVQPDVSGWTLAALWVLAVAAFGWILDIDAGSPTELGPWLAVGTVPAVLFLFASAGLSEARRARLESKRLFVLAARAAAPVASAGGKAREMGGALREEIGELHNIVASAIDHLAALEASVGHSVGSIDAVVCQAREGADLIASVLEGERTAFEGLTVELRAECEELGGGVARQVRLLREAARIFRGEQANAEGLLEAKAAILAEAAETLAERTRAIEIAAETAAAAAQRFDETLAEANETVHIAAALNDNSRTSVEDAAATAHAIAATVRETVQRALAEARRSGEALRAEAAEAEESANGAIARLRLAGDTMQEHAALAPKSTRAWAAAGSMEHLRAANGGTVAFEPTAGATLRRTIRKPAPAAEPQAQRGARSAQPSLAERAVAILEAAGIRATTGFAPEDIHFILDRGPSRRRATLAAFPDLVDQLADYLSLHPSARAEAALFRSRVEIETLPAHIPSAAAYLLIEAAIG